MQVGHNVRIGRDVLLAAQVGISGSATLEDRVTLGGQVGVQGHIVIGRGAIAAGQSGVTNSVEPGRFVTGYPAIDNRAWRKASVVFAQLPALRERLKAVERRLGLAANRAVTEGATPEDDDARRRRHARAIIDRCVFTAKRMMAAGLAAAMLLSPPALPVAAAGERPTDAGLHVDEARERLVGRPPRGPLDADRPRQRHLPRRLEEREGRAAPASRTSSST